MTKSRIRIVLLLIILFFTTGCDAEGEISYSPPGIPIKVSVNTNREVRVGFSGQWQFPIGTFEVSGSSGIKALQSRYPNPVLIVRVDDEAVVYPLESGKEFKVSFDDDNTLYRRVALVHEEDGDIILELESVHEVSAPITNTGNGTNSNESGSTTGDIQNNKNYVSISCAEDITQAALRKSPGYTSKDDSVDILYKVDCGQRLELLGGSQSADGLTWWHVSWRSYDGWMADHTGKGRTILIFE